MTHPVAKLKRAIKRLVKAEVAYSWKGAESPETEATLERELKLARKRCKEALANVSTALSNAASRP
jgi:hypothetical protein